MKTINKFPPKNESNTGQKKDSTLYFTLTLLRSGIRVLQKMTDYQTINQESNKRANMQYLM